jgi:small subunit ribosomal protein S18
MNDDKDRSQKRMHRMKPKRKICAFCLDKSKSIDYKDTMKLKRFLTERGKIQPRRTSGVCARHQRELATAIKRARVVAMLPYSQD